MQTLRNRIGLKLVSNRKDYLKWTSKLSYQSQKIFENDLFAIGKNRGTLSLSKPAYIKMCILDLSKVLMHEFHYDFIKTNIVTKLGYYLLILIVYCTKLKLKIFVKIWVRTKKCLIFINYSAKSKFCINSNALDVGKMKDKTAGLPIR